MILAAYQPDIPQNVGALMRLAAGFDVLLDLIEPFGFPWDERKIKQSAIDYYDAVKMRRYKSWNNYTESNPSSRVVLMTTKGAMPYTDFKFQQNDILLLGRESSGVPEEVHTYAHERIYIPMSPKIRSYNVAMSGGIALAEAMRQIRLIQPY
ncbi:MAG: tRNA methyltransferase [Micavibrio aeruginosavorus]|uniref:Putative tRNA (cytidine(34)-2'-O)-methyltransferase n=1 Tax=Micavibrio aeruginosavorus TaxID=349221 RepID=A0A2W5HK57_9BACT|nr:MAG: tRNA methyltransferase [Micavibrio aeruginosavorus]